MEGGAMLLAMTPKEIEENQQEDKINADKRKEAEKPEDESIEMAKAIWNGIIFASYGC